MLGGCPWEVGEVGAKGVQCGQGQATVGEQGCRGQFVVEGEERYRGDGYGKSRDVAIEMVPFLLLEHLVVGNVGGTARSGFPTKQRRLLTLRTTAEGKQSHRP